MWQTFILGKEIGEGNAFRGGEGKGGAIYRGKDDSCPEKGCTSPLNSAPNLKEEGGGQTFFIIFVRLAVGEEAFTNR